MRTSTQLSVSTQRATKSGALQRLVRDQRGVGLIEYAMLAVLIAVVAYAGFTSFGSTVNGAINNANSKVTELTTKQN